MTEPVQEDDAYTVFRERWAMEVGRFVIAFGSIESMSYAIIRGSLRDPIGEILLESMPLGKRLEVIIAMAYGRGGDWDTVAKVLERVQKLADKRNMIAHNGVTLDVFISPEGHAEHRKEAEALDSQLLKAVEAVTAVD